MPVVAVLATHRRDATVLVSPVWHRWRDGGFEIWVGGTTSRCATSDTNPQATVLVAETDLPYRGVEVRGEAELVDRGVTEAASRSRVRTSATSRGSAFVGSNAGDDLIVRVAPGESLRTWDFADDFPPADLLDAQVGGTNRSISSRCSPRWSARSVLM